MLSMAGFGGRVVVTGTCCGAAAGVAFSITINATATAPMAPGASACARAGPSCNRTITTPPYSHRSWLGWCQPDLAERTHLRRQVALARGELAVLKNEGQDVGVALQGQAPGAVLGHCRPHQLE